MSQVIMIILIFCSILGAIDKIFGNKYGYGSRFEAGIREMGTFALTMVGIYCLSPVIARLVLPILRPLSNLTGADPSVFICSILGADLGGYTSSVEIGATEEIIKFSGLILASMLGTTISFNIPMATNLVRDMDFENFSKGTLCGIVTVPLGVFVGGLAMGMQLNTLIINLIPIIIIAFSISLALIKYPEKTINLFINLGKAIGIVSLIGFVFSMTEFMFDIKIIKGMLPFEEGLFVVAKISIILSGAYSLIAFLSKILRYNLVKLSERIGINESSIMGLFTSLVNIVPMLAIFNQMDWKGQILNGAFSVGGAFILGGQLGFVSSIASDMVVPFFLSKIVAGITALIAAVFFIKYEEKTRLEEFK